MNSIFFDSNVSYSGETPQYDRPNSAADLRRVFSSLFKNGVFATPSNTFSTTKGAAMQVVVAPGMCCINGAFGWAAAAEILQVAPSSLTYPRVDTVVLRFSLENEKRNIELAVVTGVPSKTPVAKPLVRGADIFELGIATVLVPAKATGLEGAKITDTRLDTTLCGFVTGAITQVSTTTLFDQLQAVILENQAYYSKNFEDWFKSIQSILNENAAGNLHAQIAAMPKIIISNQSTMPPVENGAILIW